MNVFYCHFTNMCVNNLILFLSVDDLDISPDFYEYFSATFPVLHQDPSLWCVSAWNDNGKVGMVSEEAGQRSKVQCCTLDHMTCAHSAPSPPLQCCGLCDNEVLFVKFAVFWPINIYLSFIFFIILQKTA